MTVGEMGLVMETLMAGQRVASMEKLMVQMWVRVMVELMVNITAGMLEHKMGVYLVIHTADCWENYKDHLSAVCLEKLMVDEREVSTAEQLERL